MLNTELKKILKKIKYQKIFILTINADMFSKKHCTYKQNMYLNIYYLLKNTLGSNFENLG